MKKKFTIPPKFHIYCVTTNDLGFGKEEESVRQIGTRETKADAAREVIAHSEHSSVKGCIKRKYQSKNEYRIFQATWTEVK